MNMIKVSAACGLKMIDVQRVFTMHVMGNELVIVGGKHSRDTLSFDDNHSAVQKMGELRKIIEDHQSIRMFETFQKSLINPVLTYSVDVVGVATEFSNANGNQMAIYHETYDDAVSEFERYEKWVGDHFTKDATFQGMIHDFDDGEFFKVARRCSDTYYKMHKYEEGKVIEIGPRGVEKEIKLCSLDHDLLYELIEEGKR